MPRTQRTTIDALAAARSTSGYSSSRPASVCCFESLRRLSERRSESVSCSRSNRTAAATSGPASEPRPASSAPATKRRSRERSKAKRRRPVRAARFLEGADPVWRPVGEEGSSDDPLLWDRSPCTAVIALATIVAHHKKVTGLNMDRLPQIAELLTRMVVLVDERFVLLLERSVRALCEENPVVDHLDPIARHRDHAFDEVAVRMLGRRRVTRMPVARLVGVAAAVQRRVCPLRRLEHDDVASARFAERRSEPVHEDPLADLEGRDHRR